MYKTLGINIGSTIVLHSCFTDTFTRKLLSRICIETSCKQVLYSAAFWSSSLWPQVIIQAGVDFNSSNSSSSPITTIFFPPRKITVNIFSFFWTTIKNRLFADYGTWKNIIELKPCMKSLNSKNWGDFPFDITPLVECFKEFFCLKRPKSDCKHENIFIGITWYSHIQNLYCSRFKYFINISWTCKVHILQFGISHSRRGTLAISSSKSTIYADFLFVCHNVFFMFKLKIILLVFYDLVYCFIYLYVLKHDVPYCYRMNPESILLPSTC